MKTRRLTADVEIPYLGFGTYLIADGDAAAATSAAIRAGYRHIDTAEVYGNESGVGAGIKQGLASEGLTRTSSSSPRSCGQGTRRGGSRRRPPSPRWPRSTPAWPGWGWTTWTYT